MVSIDYVISEFATPGFHQKSLTDADLDDFDYYLFLGDVTIRFGEVDLVATSVPLLGVAHSLVESVRVARLGEVGGFDFSEGEGGLSVAPPASGSDCFVEYQFLSQTGATSTDLVELERASHSFLVRVLLDLCQRYPELSLNPTVQAWRSP